MPTISKRPPKKPGQATLDKIPPWLLEKFKKEQQAAFLNKRDTAGAQEIFRSMDGLKKLQSLVRAGAPKNTLFEAEPRPANPDARAKAVSDYLFWMRRRKHPEFEKRIGYAVSDVNRFRKILDPKGRAKLDAELEQVLTENGHHPRQFEIHFPQVVQRQPYAERQRKQAGKKRPIPPIFD